MRVIALIDDPAVVRRILEHLGRWAPEPAERGPPVQAPDWPRNAVILLADHPPEFKALAGHRPRITDDGHYVWDVLGSGSPRAPAEDCR